jgi:hypothetical protein
MVRMNPRYGGALLTGRGKGKDWKISSQICGADQGILAHLEQIPFGLFLF